MEVCFVEHTPLPAKLPVRKKSQLQHQVCMKCKVVLSDMSIQIMGLHTLYVDLVKVDKYPTSEIGYISIGFLEHCREI